MKSKLSVIRGFTLVELLIAITIIAILSSLALVSYTTIQKNARDARRKTDINSLVTAVELYKQINNVYPPASCVANSSFSSLIDSNFINKIPTDPSCIGSPGQTAPTCGCGTSGNNYYFGSAGGRIYFLSSFEGAADTTSTCGALNGGGGVGANNVFKYCYAP